MRIRHNAGKPLTTLDLTALAAWPKSYRQLHDHDNCS